MTKKDNKRSVVRRTRRILNGAKDFFAKVSGRRLHYHGYGSGVGRADLREREEYNHFTDNLK